MYSHKMRHRTGHLKDQKYALRDVHVIATSFIFLYISNNYRARYFGIFNYSYIINLNKFKFAGLF